MMEERALKSIKTVTESLANHIGRAPIAERLLFATNTRTAYHPVQRTAFTHPLTHILSIFNELNTGYTEMLKKHNLAVKVYK